MEALVTGAAGFIGSRLCRVLSGRGVDVRALVMPGERREHIKDYVAEIREGDLTDPLTLRGLASRMDAVFHLAARVADWGGRKVFYNTILTGTENLLEASRGLTPRFVFVSSIAASGLGRHLTGHKEINPDKKSGVPYNDAKLDAEALVRSFNGKKGMDCTIVRPANVIGPGSVWVTEVLDRFRKGGVPLIDGGLHSASLIGVDNLIDGIILAGTAHIAAGQTYQFRDDWSVSWKRYLTDLGRMIGKKPSFSIPFSWAWKGGALLEKLLTPFGVRPPLTRLAAGVMGRDMDVDTTKAQAELGWRTVVTYQQAMAEIEAWIESGGGFGL